MGCHFLLQCMKVKSESEDAQSCPTLHDSMDCSLPGSSIHGVFQARVLEWVAIAFSGNAVDLVSIPGLERSPGEGKGYPLQYSGLENSTDCVASFHGHDFHFLSHVIWQIWYLAPKWRRQWHPTPVLLPGKSHGQRSLVGCSPQGQEESDTTEQLHF